MAIPRQPFPKARSERLVVQELMDEVVIYDLSRHRSHCLNRTAALIWRQCDGDTSIAMMARRLQQESGTDADEETVWLVLHRLSKANLLEEQALPEAGRDRATRRSVLRRLAAIGGVSLVSSIVVPAAVAASITPEQFCENNCCGPAGGCASGGISSNNCKCCFVPGPPPTAICSGNCGNDCKNPPLNGECVPLPNTC
jgi:hypothetical protein